MARFALRRAASVPLILLGVTLIVFVTMQLVPGDPVTSVTGVGASPDVIDAVTSRYGLDRPVWQQYVVWLGHALTGDLGESISKKQAIAPLLVDAFGNTLLLTAFATVIALVGGVLLGYVGASARIRGLRRASSGLSTVALSLPQYSVAILLIALIAVPTGLFPTGSMAPPGSGPAEQLHHLLLPGLTAALVPLGMIARETTVSLRDVLSQDFIESYRARGLSEARITLHALHNVLPSVIGMLGLQIGYLLGGVVFIETIFSWPGIGLLVFQAISQRDFPIIQGGVLLTAFAFVAVNYVVDVLHAGIDPRVRVA